MTNHCDSEERAYIIAKKEFYKRERKKKCRGGCYNLPGAANAQGLPRAGNTNLPGWQSTYVYKYTHRILLGLGKSKIINQHVDVFGTNCGSPNSILRRPPNNYN